MAKYKFAIYDDINGEEQKIYPNDLHDLTKLAFARDQELFDETKQIRLYPRYRKDSPHFYSLQNVQRNIINRGENSVEHKNRIDDLIDKLNNNPKIFKIGYYTFSNDSDDGKRQFNELASTKNYTWGKEITRFISENSICRHDIYGQQEILSQSSIHPSIAIEVIDSHYPDSKVINEWLELTKIIPLIITFDLVKKKNYYLQIKDNDYKVEEERNTIRMVYYIFDGSVWKGSVRRTDIVSGGDFRELLLQE